MAGFTSVHRSQLTPLLLRAALALVFTYAAVASFMNPSDWVGYLPGIVRTHLNAEALLHVFSIYELSLALWLLSGRATRWAALAAAATLGGIVVPNFQLFVITFRDLALMVAAFALYFSSSPHECDCDNTERKAESSSDQA